MRSACCHSNIAYKYFAGSLFVISQKNVYICISNYMVLNLYIQEFKTLELADLQPLNATGRASVSPTAYFRFLTPASLFLVCVLLTETLASICCFFIGFFVLHNQPSWFVSEYLCGQREWWKRTSHCRGGCGQKKGCCWKGERQRWLKNVFVSVCQPLCVCWVTHIGHFVRSCGGVTVKGI